MDFRLQAHVRPGPFIKHAVAPPPIISTNLLSSSGYRSSSDEVRFLDVPLDHDSQGDSRRHQIRYWVDDSSWNGAADAPMFVEMPGESATYGPGRLDSFISGHGGVGLWLEHRFFGNSVPAGLDTSSSSLKYLTAEQSLADVADLVDHVKGNLNLTGPVVAYGCSYPGALAAWLRTRYPNKINAAIAASAPVSARVNFHDLDLSISLALRRVSPSCLSKVSATMDAVDSLMAEGAERRQEVKQMFGVPHDDALPQGDFDLRYMLADAVAMGVQTGGKKSLCSSFDRVDPKAAPLDLVQQFAQVTKRGAQKGRGGGVAPQPYGPSHHAPELKLLT